MPNLTEDGAYDLNGATSDVALMAVSREADWKWAVPSEDEWYKAGYHKNEDTASYFDYPTSSNIAPGYVNNSHTLSGTGDPFTEGGTDPGNYATYDPDDVPNGIGPDYYRTEVGEWENSGSPYGTFDQGGNVWEWNEAILPGDSRGLRGGSFVSHAFTDDDTYLHASRRGFYYSPPQEQSYVGFRVASIPEPGSITLLVCGAVGLLAYGWRRHKRT